MTMPKDRSTAKEPSAEIGMAAGPGLTTSANAPVPARRFAGQSQMRFLAHGIRLEEAGPPRLPLMACCAGCLLVLGAILAASLIQLNIWSMVSGRLTPRHGQQLIQTFEGGIVDQVFVDERQTVKAGQVLISLHNPDAEAELARLHDRKQVLEARAGRLRHLAFGSGRWSSSASTMDALSIQGALLQLNDASKVAQAALIRAEIDRHAASLLSQRSALRAKQQEVALFADELARKRTLLSKGLIAATEILTIERSMREREAEAATIEGSIRTAEAAMIEAEQRLAGLLATEREDKGDELATTLHELDEVIRLSDAVAAKVQRGVVTAPVDGIVNDLPARQPGLILAPGDVVAEITPQGHDLVAEVRIPPAEISHIAVGQPVRIAIDGLEPHRFGYLDGTLREISPSTFEDDQGVPYYEGLIALGASEIGDPRETRTILPGMTVTAQIGTGTRTVIGYLLKPLNRVWSSAFNEQ
jgi:HlyD family secretion protein/adhesin transport system membrane fusion protein